MKYKDKIDALGLLCPLPVLKLRKRMKNLIDGDIIKIITDDPAAKIDIPYYCIENGHQIVQSSSTKNEPLKNEEFIFYIKKQIIS